MKHVNDILQLAASFEQSCTQALVKLAKIRKLPNGRYRVLSQDGKNLGTYKSREGAKKRLKQVEYFKHFDHNDAKEGEVIDLRDADEFTFSAIMRKLRQEASNEQVKAFLKLFKAEFDKGVKAKIHKPEKVALQNTMVKFNKIHKIKIDKKLVKNAAVAELGTPEQVGKYLADICRFSLARVPADKQLQATERLKLKLYYLNEGEIASKVLPASSAIGQSITFVKHVLFNHDSHYVREVLNNIVRNL